MHMADALLSPVVAGTMYVCSTTAAGYSVNRIKKYEEAVKIPEMGVMGAFVFAAQMINFTIPGTGSSGHLCGGMLLGAMLGPQAGFLTMTGILLIQCLLFADGGILALGANIWNMAFWGCFLGAGLIWRYMMKRGASKSRIIAASVLGCVVSLQLGAFSVVLQTAVSGVVELPLTAFLGVMQPIHLAIGLVEGFITAAVLCFVYEARPELLWGMEENGKNGERKKRKVSAVHMITIMAAAALVTAGGFSLLASEYPDGLEWSVERLTGSTELERTGRVYEELSAVQEQTALLPDYGLPDSVSPAGTSLSGITGAVVTALFCMLICVFVKGRRRSRAEEK